MFRLKSRSWGWTRPCSWEVVIESSGAGDGSYFDVLLWWDLHSDGHKCVHWVHWAWGFLCMASDGDGWLKSDTMSVGPCLLVCLLITGAAACSMAGASWLTGLTGVGCLIMVACWASSSVDGLWSGVLRFGWVLSMLIPLRTCDTVDLTSFLSAILERVHLIPVCLLFHVGDWGWWNPSLGSLVGSTKLCSLYNKKY